MQMLHRLWRLLCDVNQNISCVCNGFRRQRVARVPAYNTTGECVRHMATLKLGHGLRTCFSTLDCFVKYRYGDFS
jgi:hypothetical protein